MDGAHRSSPAYNAGYRAGPATGHHQLAANHGYTTQRIGGGTGGRNDQRHPTCTGPINRPYKLRPATSRTRHINTTRRAGAND